VQPATTVARPAPAATASSRRRVSPSLSPTAGFFELCTTFTIEVRAQVPGLSVEGQGWSQLIAGLNTERVIVGALALGQARRSFTDTLNYAARGLHGHTQIDRTG
jgi:hypothetical protein